MSEGNWQLLTETGPLEAELLQGLLEAQGVPVFLTQEGAGRAYGITIGALGIVQVLVPVNLFNRASLILDDYLAGKYELPDEDESTDEGDADQLEV